MRRGHIAALPWRSGKETACASCAYGALCRFSVREGKAYRQLLDGKSIDVKLGLSEEAGGSAVDE
jgi:ATP-dependent helicase/DNAse subunit B